MSTRGLNRATHYADLRFARQKLQQALRIRFGEYLISNCIMHIRLPIPGSLRPRTEKTHMKAVPALCATLAELLSNCWRSRFLILPWLSFESLVAQ